MSMVGTNAVQRSKYKEEVDELLDRGISLREIIRTLKRQYPKFNDFSLTTLSLYAKQRREENDVRQQGLVGMDSVLSDSYIRSIERAVLNQGYVADDAMVLDYIISKGFSNLVAGNRLGIGLNDIFRAIDRKSRILGPRYTGETSWALLDQQAVFQEYMKIVQQTVPAESYEKICELCVKAGIMNA